MLFNSLEFALFLPIVFIFYWFITNKNLKSQNTLIVVVSYFFYGWWDWRFLLLIGFTSLCSFYSGILIAYYRENVSKSNYAKWITVTNIILNLLILCTFKYFNFFSENLEIVFNLLGFKIDWVTLNILLPVGISFYTFQALSYTIDVYNRKIEPTKDIISFFAFVSFFPQLVAGPIERATNLLPQFYKNRSFNYEKAVDGMRQILWGFFKKIVIADNCSMAVNDIFTNYQTMSSSTLLVGAILFSFQIYGDFSGYSDIAIGTARLFGFNLLQNFNSPYFSRDIAEFWRRWHISLTTWFRDYIYIPLGGSMGGKWNTFRNTIIIFIISGFWHGANWTFIVWGVYHALLFLPLVLLNQNRKYTDTVAQTRFFPTIREGLQMFSTFILVMFGWIIFRATTISEAFLYIKGIFTSSLFTKPIFAGGKQLLMYIIILMIVEWIGRHNKHALEKLVPHNCVIRWSLYIILIILIIGFGGKQSSFIYFQF